ncbi:GGDEF domain-containing protein [Rhodococcoides corynebacterioides]|uniref:Diguanylate cyclase n=2 Tax=Rhodococcoides corynebacterioides TaxID=53972 RepID=A0ABS7P3M6_9NOCA|nr:GGDEF domain-containing protein [Rhodococcus corynebacterioides]MBY6367024.1 diguanylate cyclase [Rhodococcus corynebacterioides]MBY6407285.1 diguanylate cyclase [Rhodococcus corynebacterioides]
MSPSDHRQRSSTPFHDGRSHRDRRADGPGRHSSPEQRIATARRGRRVPAFGGRIATGPVAVFRRWLTTPHDFDWIFVHRSTRPLHGLIKGVVVFGVGLNALVSMLMLGSPYGPSGTAEVTWVMIVLAAQIAVIAWVTFAPTPTRKAQFLGLLLFGDLGITSVILLDTPTSALIGTFLFALNGALCTFFLSARILLAHLAFVNVVIAWIGLQAYLQGLWGINDAVAAVLVASGSVSGVPVFAHIAWSLVSADARASEFDELTGVANRRGLQNAVDELWDVARSRGVSVAVLLVDIDRFKAVNDRFGHDRGDAVIRTVASRLHALLGARCSRDPGPHRRRGVRRCRRRHGRRPARPRESRHRDGSRPGRRRARHGQCRRRRHDARFPVVAGRTGRGHPRDPRGRLHDVSSEGRRRRPRAHDEGLTEARAAAPRTGHRAHSIPMTSVFHGLVAMNSLFAASAWCLARPTRLSAAATAVASVGWLFFNGPIEGRVLVVFSPQHGITESDLLSVVGVAIAVTGWWRWRRARDRALPVR